MKNSSKTERKIAIIGAGQAGLQLAIHLLLKKKYQISLYTEQNAAQIQNGRIFSTQGMFCDALQIEKSLGLNLWDDTCPQNSSVEFSLAANKASTPLLKWTGKTKKTFQAIDQRLKFSEWMNLFEKLGGDVYYQRVTHEELNYITDEHELTLIATGKGELSEIFPINTTYSTHNSPQRILSSLYLTNTSPVNAGLHANMLPEIGELFSITGLTQGGVCEMLLFEGIPGKGLDCWQDVLSIEDQHQQAKLIMKKYFPWEFERFSNSQMTDPHAGLIGQYTPKICHPIAKLNNGKLVLGIGDAIVLNDPIAGQGANSACKTAFYYAEAICQHHTKKFDEQWMLETANMSWEKYSKYATFLSNFLLKPPPYLMEAFKAACEYPTVANELANGFNNPDLIYWLYNQEQCMHYLKSHDNAKYK